MGKLVEIDEEELLRSNKLRQTVAAILANPIAKLKVQEATKLVFPNAVTPELDQAKANYDVEDVVAKKIGELEKTISDDRAQRVADERMRELQAKHEAGFRKLREEGYKDAGIDAIRKIMEERGIIDHEVAVAVYEKQNPPQAPLTPNGRAGWGFMDAPAEAADQDFVKQLIESKGENVALLDKRAHETLNEVRASARR